MNETRIPPRGTLHRVLNGIIAWYERSGRRFPWRQSSSPYEILIAEMMLRRTTATAVSKVYGPFLVSYPSPKALSKASLDSLAELVAPLGLQRTRSVHLKEAAAKIVQEWSGAVPTEFEALISLPGVGRYVASAVRNFAFGKPEPLVDNNVIHLTSRLFGVQFSGPNDPGAWDLMSQLGGEEQDSRLYWGIIDLVSTICRRRSPKCPICPLVSDCQWSAQQR